MLRFFINLNKSASNLVDSCFPKQLNLDGNLFYLEEVLPKLISNLPHGSLILEVGGGKQPFLTSKLKETSQLKVHGLDISKEELLAAPQDIYDNIIVADICNRSQMSKINHQYDLIICQSLIEHVPDALIAIDNMSTLLKDNSIISLFAPNGTAPFAIINKILPQNVKKKILFYVKPKAQIDQGFPAFYVNCNPMKIDFLLRKKQLKIETKLLFYQSSYFSFIFPLYVIWKITKLPALLIPPTKNYLAESFIYTIRK